MTRYCTQLIGLNSDGQLLFQHRTADALSNPNKWDLFGGGMEEGESPEEGLRRELLEELELTIGPLKFYIEKTIVTNGDAKTRYYFVGNVVRTEAELRKQQHEGQNLAFLWPREVKDLDLVSHHREVLDQFVADLLR